ncbi:MAG: outer membrane beta-barrel protein, partial [Vibrio sp.]
TRDTALRGKDTTEGFTPEQYTYYGLDDQGLKTRFSNLETRYYYGAPEARGSLSLAYLRKELQFKDLAAVKNADGPPPNTTGDPNNDGGEGNSDFYQYILGQQWYENTYIIELFDQISSDTRFRYSVVNNNRFYDNTVKNWREYFFDFGVQSQYSGKTYYEMNLAWLYKTFYNNSFADDFNGFNWQAKLDWQPKKHSTVTLRTIRQLKDPSEVGGYILDNQYGVAWEHFWWVDRFSSTISYTYQTQDYEKQDRNRHDTGQVVKVELAYDFRPSIHFKLGYQFDTWDSDLDTDCYSLVSDKQCNYNASDQNDRSFIVHQIGYDQHMFYLTAKVQI